MHEPMVDLVAVLGQLMDRSGTILPPRFYDAVQPVTAEEEKLYEGFETQFSSLTFFTDKYGVEKNEALLSSSPKDLLMRRWRQPSLTIHSISGSVLGLLPTHGTQHPRHTTRHSRHTHTHTHTQARTQARRSSHTKVRAREASRTHATKTEMCRRRLGAVTAKLSVRIVPNQRPEEIYRMFASFLHEQFDALQSGTFQQSHNTQHTHIAHAHAHTRSFTSSHTHER
jgi:hypothetical protein